MREGNLRARVAPQAGRHDGRDARPAFAPKPAAALRCIALVGPSAASMAVALGGLMREMTGRGHHVICLSPHIDMQTSRELARLGAETEALPSFRQGFSPLADPRSIVRLVAMFRRIRPDVAAGYAPKAAALAAAAAKIAGIEHVVSVIDELGRGFAEPPQREAPFARRYQKTLMRSAFGLSHAAVILNEENQKLLQRHRMIPEGLKQFSVHGSGVDLSQFPETMLPPLQRGVLFLFAGPLDRRLGVHDYCEAARLLRVKSGNFRCLLAGPEIDGPHAFALSELKRYRDVVQYLGPQADPRPFMARTHVFVLPAYGDAVPPALFEAMAFGRPVITTTARGCRNAVRDGTNGALVPPGDPAALAGAMARLLLRPDLIPSMARVSRGLAESRFDSRRVNARLLAAFGL